MLTPELASHCAWVKLVPHTSTLEDPKSAPNCYSCAQSAPGTNWQMQRYSKSGGLGLQVPGA